MRTLDAGLANLNTFDMKRVLIIPDGVADETQPSLGDKTPLQAANVPNMDAVAAAGITGLTDNVPTSMPSGSDVGTMSLFGYNPLTDHTGRAPLEAAAQGIELGPNDWAIRCNLVFAENDVMKSFTAEQVPSHIGTALVHAMQSALPKDTPWQFVPGVSYRNLLLYRGEKAASTKPPFAADTLTVPPHDITDQPIADYLPKGTGGCDLRDLMDLSRDVFESVGLSRTDGHPMPTQCWLWGQGSTPKLEPFQDRFGAQGAVITAVDLLRGIGRLIGWDVIEVEGATGYLDTDYAAKGRAGIKALDDYDFVCIHVEATDEASHEGNVEEKIKAVERIDEHIVGPMRKALDARGDDYRLLVCPDHPTFLRTKTHSHGYVPFALCGTDVAPDATTVYDELTSKATGLAFPEGWDLMPFTFGQISA